MCDCWFVSNSRLSRILLHGSYLQAEVPANVKLSSDRKAVYTSKVSVPLHATYKKGTHNF